MAYRNFKENFERLTNRAVTHLFLRLTGMGVAFYWKGREKGKDLNFEVIYDLQFNSNGCELS
jgi:hypothetical protein